MPDLEINSVLTALQRGLHYAGCEVTDLIDHTVIQSVYFTDPNSVAFEASCWLLDPTTALVDYDGLLFADPDSVTVVRELRSDSSLAPRPTTVLAGSSHSAR